MGPTHVPRPSRHAPAPEGARPAHLRLDQSVYRAAFRLSLRRGKQGGYLLKKPNGDVWQTDQWQAGMGIVDFTNPDACKWFGDKLRALLDMGVDSFKTDFGERIPTDVVYFDGSDPHKMHNFYSYLYNKVVFDVLEEARGEGRGGSLRPLRHRRLPAVPRPLGRRLLFQL